MTPNDHQSDAGLSFYRSNTFKHPRLFSNTHPHLKVVFKRMLFKHLDWCSNGCSNGRSNVNRRGLKRLTSNPRPLPGRPLRHHYSSCPGRLCASVDLVAARAMVTARAAAPACRCWCWCRRRCWCGGRRLTDAAAAALFWVSHWDAAEASLSADLVPLLQDLGCGQLLH